MKQPNSRANLDKAIQRLTDGDRDAYIAIRAVIANTVVGQMLPEGAVKGGSAIKLRLGNSGTRFTTDLDVARASGLDEYRDALEGELDYGKTLQTCRRLFAYRKRQPWPSPIVPGEGWRDAYDEQRRGLDVIEDVDEAVTWANTLVGRIAGVDAIADAASAPA